MRKLAVTAVLSCFWSVISGQSLWTKLTPPPTEKHLYSIAWTGTQFVVAGDNGSILTSPDGIHWTSRYSGDSGALHSVTWTGNQLIAVSSSGTFLTSRDGIDWTRKHISRIRTFSRRFGPAINLWPWDNSARSQPRLMAPTGLIGISPVRKLFSP